MSTRATSTPRSPGPDRPVSAWAAWLGTDEALARALVCAAVRETFEESGVLLAGPSADEVVADTTATTGRPTGSPSRRATLSLTDFLARRGLVLRTDLLGVWCGWTTPEFEPRRFRTWFFVADLPLGQRTRDVSSESDVVAWLPALEAVERVEAGTLGMMPPTYLTCLEVATYADPDAVLAASRGRSVEMFTPVLVEEDGGWTLSTPPAWSRCCRARAPVSCHAAWAGGSFGTVATCVLADNASPMTLDGTNTWVLRAPGAARSVVIDPGPCRRRTSLRSRRPPATWRPCC